MTDLQKFFNQNRDGRRISKWSNYFDIYERHFKRFRDKQITLVEIGVYKGGSLDMWQSYFGGGCKIVGVDINPKSRKYASYNFDIVIGDQSDRHFLAELAKQYPQMDIVIDDGGHTMEQQIATFETLFPHIAPGGVFLCEDTHTSYWKSFGGGYKSAASFIEYAKRLADPLHDPTSKASVANFVAMTESVHYYDSVVLLEKRAQPLKEGGNTGCAKPADLSRLPHPP